MVFPYGWVGYTFRTYQNSPTSKLPNYQPTTPGQEQDRHVSCRLTISQHRNRFWIYLLSPSIVYPLQARLPAPDLYSSPTTCKPKAFGNGNKVFAPASTPRNFGTLPCISRTLFLLSQCCYHHRLLLSNLLSTPPIYSCSFQRCRRILGAASSSRTSNSTGEALNSLTYYLAPEILSNNNP